MLSCCCMGGCWGLEPPPAVLSSSSCFSACLHPSANNRHTHSSSLLAVNITTPSPQGILGYHTRFPSGFNSLCVNRHSLHTCRGDIAACHTEVTPPCEHALKTVVVVWRVWPRPPHPPSGVNGSGLIDIQTCPRDQMMDEKRSCALD